MTSRFLPILLAGTVLAGLSAPALAGNADLELMGDGSDTNNRDLLRGAYECGYDCPTGPAPSEPYDPPFDIDWSIALRGSYVQENDCRDLRDEPRSGVVAVARGPALDLRPRCRGGDHQAAGHRRAHRCAAAFGSRRVRARRGHQFATDGYLTISQAAPSDPNNPAGTSISPRILDAEFAGTLTRDLGVAYVGLRGTVGRTNYGETTLGECHHRRQQLQQQHALWRRPAPQPSADADRQSLRRRQRRVPDLRCGVADAAREARQHRLRPARSASRPRSARSSRPRARSVSPCGGSQTPASPMCRR